MTLTKQEVLRDTIGIKVKPVVHYTGEPIFYSIADTEYALVEALDHPILGKEKVRTSRILSKTLDGFETVNTIYRAVKDEPKP